MFIVQVVPLKVKGEKQWKRVRLLDPQIPKKHCSCFVDRREENVPLSGHGNDRVASAVLDFLLKQGKEPVRHYCLP